MTGRERELAAIRHEVPDRLPVDAICIENTEAIAQELGIEVGEVSGRLGIDGCITAAGYTGEVLPPENGIGYSEWGTLGTGDYGTARPAPLERATTVTEVEAYAWPSADDYDYESVARWAEGVTEVAVRGPYWKPVFCQVCDLFGMEQALVLMMSEPAVYEAALRRVTDINLEYCKRLLAACGDALPILCLGDDFATQRGLMISPEHWRATLKPLYAELFAAGKAAGRFVWFHSCGDVTAVLPDLIDIGIDVWETVQLHALPLSAAELKREYGKDLAFFGGVNTQRLPFVDEEETRRMTLDAIEGLGEGGGYICGPDHHIKPDVSVGNTLALFDTARGFRRVGWTKTEASPPAPLPS